jgi:predicted metal-dependent hydrolase
MKSQIELDGITVHVVRKPVKNLNLTVRPPHGEVRISAPKRASLAEIQAFVLSKREWIRKHRERIRAEMEKRGPTKGEPRYVDGERHTVWGREVLLQVEEAMGPPDVSLTEQRLRLRVRPGTDRAGRREIVERWYRDQLRKALEPMLADWERELGVRAGQIRVRRMKTRWGSCTPSSRSIRLNTELAARAPELLEYILVHELVHLLEASHNGRFYALMGRYLPDWRERKEALERRS